GDGDIGACVAREVVAYACACVEARDALLELGDALFERRRFARRLGADLRGQNERNQRAGGAEGLGHDCLLYSPGAGPESALQVASTIAFSVALGRIARAVSLGSGW